MKTKTVIREKCGTYAGYQSHGYYKEEPCDDCRQANSARYRRWYVAAAEKERQRYKTRVENNPEYKEKHGKARIKSSHKMRAVSRGVSTEDWSIDDLLNAYGTKCHLCQEEIDLDAPRRVGEPGWERGLHCDHVVPFAAGGTNLLENVRPSHGKCNSLKSAKS